MSHRITLRDGRTARVIETAAAGTFVCVIESPMEAALAEAGASDNAISMAHVLAELWKQANIDTLARQSYGHSVGGSDLESRVNDEAYRRWLTLVGASGLYGPYIRALIAYGDTALAVVRQAVAGLQKIVDSRN